MSPAATDTCGWLTHGRRLFSACPKKSHEKKRHPRVAHRANSARSPARLTKPGARLTRWARKCRPARCARSSCHAFSRLGLDQESRDFPRLRCGAWLATTGIGKPLVPQFIVVYRLGGVFKTPSVKPSAARSRSAGPQGRARDRERAPTASGHSVGARPEARAARRNPRCWRAQTRGACFLLVTSPCTSKEKSPARGAGTAINTRPEAPRLNGSNYCAAN